MSDRAAGDVIARGAVSARGVSAGGVPDGGVPDATSVPGERRAGLWRVLVVARGTWDASSVQLAITAQALSALGVAVHVAAPTSVHARWQQALPDVTMRSIDARGSARRDAVQAMSTSMRANVALVDDDAARRLAVRVLGDGACVLQRLPLHASVPADSFVMRMTTRNIHFGYLMPRFEGETAVADAARRHQVFAVPIGTFVHDAPAATSLARETPVLVVVPDESDAMAALPALRAAARIMQRHDALRVHLLGPSRVLQGLRVQAAALHIASHVTTGPLQLDALGAPAGTVAAWVAATGETGATAVLSAMAERVPVLLPASSPLAPLIADRVTGLLVNARDPLADSLAAGHVARLLGQGEQQRSMGAAARARVQRLHGGTRLATAVLDALDALIVHARRAA